MDDGTRLNEYDKDEWFDVLRKLRPELTEEEYTAMWDAFHERKDAYLKAKSQQ